MYVIGFFVKVIDKGRSEKTGFGTESNGPQAMFLNGIFCFHFYSFVLFESRSLS